MSRRFLVLSRIAIAAGGTLSIASMPVICRAGQVVVFDAGGAPPSFTGPAISYIRVHDQITLRVTNVNTFRETYALSLKTTDFHTTTTLPSLASLITTGTPANAQAQSAAQAQGVQESFSTADIPQDIKDDYDKLQTAIGKLRDAVRAPSTVLKYQDLYDRIRGAIYAHPNNVSIRRSVVQIAYEYVQEVNTADALGSPNIAFPTTVTNGGQTLDFASVVDSGATVSCDHGDKQNAPEDIQPSSCQKLQAIAVTFPDAVDLETNKLSNLATQVIDAKNKLDADVAVFDAIATVAAAEATNAAAVATAKTAAATAARSAATDASTAAATATAAAAAAKSAAAKAANTADAQTAIAAAASTAKSATAATAKSADAEAANTEAAATAKSAAAIAEKSAAAAAAKSYAKTLVDALGKLGDAAATAGIADQQNQTSLIQAARPKLLVASDLFRFCLDLDKVPARLELTVNGISADEVTPTVQVTPVTGSVDGVTPPTGEGLPAAAPTALVGQTYTYSKAIPIYGRLVRDFSTGLVVDNLIHKNWSVQSGKIVETSHDEFDLNAGAFAQIYKTTPSHVAFGGLLGLTTGSPIRYLAGGTMVLGTRVRASLSGGIVAGQVSSLDGVTKGALTSATTAPTQNVMRAGWFGALAFVFNL